MRNTPWRCAGERKPEQPASATSTIELLERLERGEESAIGQLVERLIPSFQRWARGQLPPGALDIAESRDLVRIAVRRALTRSTSLKGLSPGALQAHLRQAVHGDIHEELRKARAQVTTQGPDQKPRQVGPSPLERLIGRERMDRYEFALRRLDVNDREAIVARLELQQSYEEIAIALGIPDAEAARQAVIRALGKLIAAMPGPSDTRS